MDDKVWIVECDCGTKLNFGSRHEGEKPYGLYHVKCPKCGSVAQLILSKDGEAQLMPPVRPSSVIIRGSA